MCPVIFKDTVVNGNHIEMADGVVILLCWQMLCFRLWQVLSPFYVIFVSDGKPLLQMLSLSFVADVIANL